MDATTQLVWAQPAGTEEVTCLYIGRDAVKAKEIYDDHSMDGAYDWVRFGTNLPFWLHTVPTKYGLPVKDRAVAEAPEEADSESVLSEEAPKGKKAKAKAAK